MAKWSTSYELFIKAIYKTLPYLFQFSGANCNRYCTVALCSSQVTLTREREVKKISVKIK